MRLDPLSADRSSQVWRAFSRPAASSCGCLTTPAFKPTLHFLTGTPGNHSEIVLCLASKVNATPKTFRRSKYPTLIDGASCLVRRSRVISAIPPVSRFHCHANYR